MEKMVTPRNSMNVIKGYISCWGVSMSDLPKDDSYILELACNLYEIEKSDRPFEVANAIKALSKVERRKKANKNIPRYLGGVKQKPVSGVDRIDETPILTERRERKQFTESQLQSMMNKAKPIMIDGAGVDCHGELDIDPAKLLTKVVSAVISSGHAEILWEYPEVLAFFGSRIPYPDEVEHLHNVDTRMFEAADRWPNRIKREN